MKVLLLGATGVAGRSSLPRLIEAGHTVTAQARSDAAAKRLAGTGATVAPFDTSDPEALRAALSGQDAVVDHRVQIPPSARAALPGAWRTFRYLRDQATAQLVEAMIEVGVTRLVRDVVSFVYADGGDGWLDEDSPVAASGPMAANLTCEGHVARLTSAGGTGVILRCGLFYGPGDRMSAETVRLARRGFAMVLGPKDAWHSALHTADVGPAVTTALEAPAGVYNLVDDEPLRRGDLVALLASCAGRSRLRRPPDVAVPLAGAAGRVQARSQRVSAARFHDLTGWRPMVPSRRAGWATAFQEITQRAR